MRGMGASAIQIDTSFLDLPSVFQTLANNKRTGVLVVKSGERQRGVRFESGSVRMVIEPDNPRFLLEALIRSQQADHETLRELAPVDGFSYSELMLASGAVVDEQLNVAYEFHVYESGCELFTWDPIECEFLETEPGDEPPSPWSGPDLDHVVTVNPNALVMEACRRLDEAGVLGEAIASENDIPSIVGLLPLDETGEGTDPAVQMVADLCDGVRDVVEVLEHVALSRFEAKMILAELCANGVLRFLTMEEMLQVARDLMKVDSGIRLTSEEKTRKLIRLYERVEERGYTNPQLTVWLGRAYEMAGRDSDAIERYISVGRQALEGGRARDAVEVLARAINLTPGNQELQALLVDAYLQDRDNEQAEEIAVNIVNGLRDAGQPDEAMRLAKAMKQADPSNERVLQPLAELHLESGDRTSAILEYEELAGSLQAKGRPAEAAAVFEKILELDYFHLMAHFRLAETLHEMGRTSDAVSRYKKLADMLADTEMGESINWMFLIKTYESIAEIEVDNVPAKEWLAATYLEQERQPEAMRHLQAIVAVLRGQPAHPSLASALKTLVTLRPSDMTARKLYAATLNQRGEPHLAVTQYLALAELSVTLEEYESARKALETAAVITPGDLGVHKGFAELYGQLGEQQLAAAKLRDVGYLLRACGDLVGAEATFQRAIELEPGQRLCLLELAQSYASRGDKAAASRLYQSLATWAEANGDYGIAWSACSAAGLLGEGVDLSWLGPLQQRLFGG